MDNAHYDRLIVKDWQGNVYALEVKTGKQLWQAKVEGGSWSSPIYNVKPFDNFHIIIGSSSGHARSNYGKLMRTLKPGTILGAGEGNIALTTNMGSIRLRARNAESAQASQ